MATLSQQQDDKDNQTAQQGGNTNVAGAGGASAPPSTSRVASYSNGAAPAQGSGRFTNLKTYVDANKGAGDQLGNKLTNNLGNQVNKASDQTQAQAIGQKVQAEKDRLAEGSQFNQQLQDRQTDQASNIAGNADTSGRFSNLLNNQNVAQGLNTEYQTAQSNQINALNTAQQNVNNLGTEQGRFQLLQNTVKNPNYTTGQQRLDQLFLQTGNPNDLLNAQRDLGKTVGQNAKQLEGMYGQLGTGISEADKQAAETAAMLRGTLGSEESYLTNAQSQKAQNTNSANADENVALDRFFSGGYDTLDANQKAMVDKQLASGNVQNGMRTYNLLNDQGYKNYVNQGSTDLKSQDVINQADFNRYSSLAKLAEQDPNSRLFTGVGAGGTSAGIKGQQLTTDAQAARAALDAQLNRNEKSATYMNGTYNTNFGDLLKYQENQGGAQTLNTGYGSGGRVLPIVGTFGGYDPSTISQTVTAYDKAPTDNYMAAGRGLGGSVGSTITKNANTTASAGSIKALQDLINRYDSELTNEGYYNTLGQTR